MKPMDDMLRLDQQFCFALYSATHALTRAYKPLLDALGLTYPQYLVLLVLWEQDRQSVGGIGDRLRLDSSTLTPLLKRLESAGLVCRERNPRNERQLIVSLTDGGRALKARAAGLPAGIACASGLAPDDMVRLRDAIVKVRDAFAAAEANEAH